MCKETVIAELIFPGCKALHMVDHYPVTYETTRRFVSGNGDTDVMKMVETIVADHAAVHDEQAVEMCTPCVEYIGPHHGRNG